MIPLRKSTASQEVLLGPFLDDTDGKTPETGLTIANTDIKLWKRGGTTESSKNSGGATHIASGRYHATLDATDTDTTGELMINVAVAGALPVRLVCHVYEAAIFDAFFASGAAGYQVPIWSSASATVNLSGTTLKAVTDAIVLPSSASINITGNITGNLSGSVGSVTGAVGSVTGNVGGSVASVTGAVGSVTGNVGGNVTGSVGSVVSGVTVTTNNDKTGYSLTQAFPANFSSLAITVGGAVTAGTVSDKTGYSLTQAFPSNFSSLSISAGGVVSANVTQWNGGTLPTIGTSTLTAQQVWEYSGARTLSAFGFTVSANVTQWNSGSLPTIPTAGENADAVWDEAMSGHTGAGTYGGRLPRSDSANVNVKLTGSAHIAADVHELQPAVIEAQHFALGAIDANALAADASSEIATAVRAELAVELARINVPIDSRLATASYTAPPTATTIADTVLSRALTTAEATAGTISLCTLVLALTGKASVTGGVLTVYRTNGSTVHATIPVASDANAEPIVGIG
jgi:hypothetical protein